MRRDPGAEVPRGSRSVLPRSQGEDRESRQKEGKVHPKLRPRPGSDDCLWWRPPKLTQGLLALHTLEAPVLHTASPLFQRRTGRTPVPWLLQDMPLADAVGDLTGPDTATPATPLGHNAGDGWKRTPRVPGHSGACCGPVAAQSLNTLNLVFLFYRLKEIEPTRMYWF